MLACNEFEVPLELLAVTNRELTPFSTDCPVGAVPWNIKGTVILNWPPKDCEFPL